MHIVGKQNQSSSVEEIMHYHMHSVKKYLCFCLPSELLAKRHRLMYSWQNSKKIVSNRRMIVFFGCENFSLPLNDLLSEKFSTQYVYKTCMSRRTESSYCRAMCVLELLMLKRDILFVPDGDFTASDIDEVIRSMCNDWC